MKLVKRIKILLKKYKNMYKLKLNEGNWSWDPLLDNIMGSITSITVED